MSTESMAAAAYENERARAERVRFLVDASIHDTSRALNQSWANVSDGARAMQANAARFLNGENIGDGPAGLLVTASLCAFAHKADSASYPADLLARFR